MALIFPQETFLDSRIYNNFESLSGNNWNDLHRNHLDGGSHIPKPSGAEHSQDSFYSILLPLTPITSWRRAQNTDVPQIEKLCTPETETVYGSYNLDCLVESSLLPIVLLNELDEVVAFMAVQDFPNIPFLSTTDWEQWIDDMYQVRTYHSLNTCFIHLLVWNNRYEETFLKKILAPVFMENSFVEYILLILPYGMDLNGPYEKFFFFYLAIMDIANEKRSVKLIREFKEKYLLNMYVALRIFIGPDIKIRKAKKEDNDKITNLLHDYPKLKFVFDKNFIIDLLTKSTNKKHRRRVLISEYKIEDETKYGLITYFKHVNLDIINQCYDTFSYNGFKKYIDMDSRNKAFEKWNRVDHEHPLKLFDRTVKADQKDIYYHKSKQSPSTFHSPVSFFPYSEKRFVSLDQVESNEDISTLDRGFSVTKMKTEQILVEKTNIEDEEKEDHTQYELKRQICLSYANEETVCKKKNELCEELPIPKYINEKNQHHKKKKTTAMEIELYFPPKDQDPRLVLYYLKYIFEKTPQDKTFILISVRSHNNFQPLLSYFQGLERIRSTCDNRDLYVCHRMSITGLFLVREAEMGDFEEIMALTIRNPHYQSIHRDVFDILRNQDLPESEIISPYILQRCYVFICCNLLIGFAVVGNEDNVDYLVGNYNVEDFIYYSLHRRDSHGYVRHFVLVPSFLHLTTYFLRQIMKINQWTCLYTYMIPGNLMKAHPEFSIPSGLIYWIPVQPRQLPEYWKEGLGDLTPHCTLIYENMQPFALYHMNYKMSGVEKRLYTFKIVVVGGGELALSFLEHLIFSPTSWYMGYKNITLISQGGLANKFEKKYENLVKTMMVTGGRYSQEYLDRLSLFTWVDVVEGMVTSIDRKKRFLLVDEMYDFDYDYLFLFCGTQFVKPQPAAEFVPNKECRVLIDEIKGIEEANSDMPCNLFLINNDKDAFYALMNLKEVLDNWKSGGEDQIVVYGHCLNALSCIAGLLEVGISGSLITFIEPKKSPFRSTDYAFNPEVYNSIKNSLEQCNIQAHYHYSFTCWETGEHVLFDKRRITKVHFQSHNHVISIPTMALFSFEPKTVHHQTRLALQKACLVFDEKLVIDSNFLTNDKNIYAAGSLTRYKKKYYCNHYNHYENYSSYEIGIEIAYRFQRRIRLEEMGHEYLNKRNVTEFTSPTIVNCKLPGGWNYLHITKPGPMFPMQTIVAYQKSWGKVLHSGNPYDYQGPGYFRIIINHCELVCDILCFTTKKIDVHNMICLYNKHESLLNQMCLRFDGGLILDFFLYFREPWAYALYHDRFSLFMEEIQEFYLKQVENEAVSFYEAVAYAFNVCKWQKISNKDKELLEDLFNYVPELKGAIKKKLLEFMGNNENQLTTYLTWKRFIEYEVLFKRCRLLDPVYMGRGMLPLVSIQPEYIVPTPGRRKGIEDRIMERTLEQMFFHVPSGLDDESENKFSEFSSEHSVHSQNITYVPKDASVDIPYVEIDLAKFDSNNAYEFHEGLENEK